MHLVDAIILGVVEGLTEFLPISSTGHLILTAQALGLSGEAVKSFQIVIQAGAAGAVLLLYWPRVAEMLRGVAGTHDAGRRLLINLAVSTTPAVVAGLLLHRWIKATLFTTWAVVGALAVGGVAMILVERWRARAIPHPTRTLDSLTVTGALAIGLAQCLALWPGTSRAMVTIVAALLLGCPATTAAEYSFLLAIPTLGAATLFEAGWGGAALIREAGWIPVVAGFVSAAVVAVVAVRGLVRWLTTRGLTFFGWYRIGLAAVVWWTVGR